MQLVFVGLVSMLLPYFLVNCTLVCTYLPTDLVPDSVVPTQYCEGNQTFFILLWVRVWLHKTKIYVSLFSSCSQR